MAAYFIFAYDIANPDEYAKYNPGSLPIIMETIQKHGGQVRSVGPDGAWLADQRQVVVLLEFPSADAAKAWEADPDYAPARKIRHAATSNRVEVVIPKFVPPER